MSGHKAWGDFKSTVPLMAAPQHAMPHQIRVLLVDHNIEELIRAARLLEACQYRVTYIEFASAAISMISAGKASFDVVIADINNPDLHGHKLLQCSVAAELPIVLMSADDSIFMASRALESGALLYVNKPLSFDVAKYMWQHVVRERRVKMVFQSNLRLPATTTMMNNNIHHNEHQLHHSQENPNNGINNIGGMMMMGECAGLMMKKSRGRSIGLMNHGYDEDVEGDLMNQGSNNVKKKACTEWTHELHNKFIDAVEKLGEGRCFPKEILELMSVPGLTRMQVASHLQKCRNNNWRSPEERKTNLGSNSSERGPELSLSSLPRRFGSKPVMARAIPFNLGLDDPNMAASSSRVRPPSDDFFSFSDNMESLINSFSGIQQGETSNANQVDGGGYNHEQNYGVPPETKSYWSPEASGDDSAEKKGQE